MKLAILGVLAILAGNEKAWADNYPRQPGVDVQHYIFRVTLNDENSRISGETSIDVRFLNDGITTLALDLASAVNGKGMTVSEISSSGNPVRYSHAENRLVLNLDIAPKAGEHRRFLVRYGGVAADGLHIGANKFGERTFFSNNWPDLARQWLPVLDHPYDKASSEFLVTAPVRYQVVANGVLEEEVDLGDGMRLTHWNQKEPIATWLNNIGVARFSSRHIGMTAGAPLQVWVFPQDREAGSGTFDEATRKSIAFFAERVGAYPYGKLADVEATSFGGGMENASAIFYGEKAVNGAPAFGLVSHEIAHQWFGDSVTEKDWDDVWLSEGFATYFSQLAIEHYEGHDAFVTGMEERRKLVFEAEKNLPGVAVVQEKPWNGIPNGIVYQKGAWVLHLLRGQLGTEAFWKGIREYYRRYRDSSASTSDFQLVMEEISGQRLDWFFRQWVYRAGSPVLEGEWRYNAAAKRVDVDLTQVQPGEVYRLPLEIGISSGRIEKVEMDKRHQHFEFAVDREPSAVVLDPNVWMLCHARLMGR